MLHHVEIWVADLAASTASLGWLLTRLGYTVNSQWANGISYSCGEFYIVLESGPDAKKQRHDRLAPGLNHLAFHAGTRQDVDTLAAEALDHGFTLMFAQLHHSAMRHVGPTRVELGTRTIFNLLGPLSNPAGAKRQLLGVFSPRWLQPIAEVLRDLGSESIWVVHGDGMDEITTTGVTHVAALENGKIRTFDLTPKDFGVSSATIDDLKGGDGIFNAKALRGVLSGHKNAYRDVSLCNAAAALVVAGKAETLSEGMKIASASLDEGKAAAALDRLVAVSNEE